jgi:formylglycine-generating enzyme required for sulfatase activity
MGYRSVQKGDRISEYTLLEKLGQGGFGEVWKAEHTQIPGKFVAVKIPTSLESMDCLKQEAVFQHELDHPNIVKTIGLNTQNDPPYFIMEYVEGKNLRQLMLDDGILPPPYAIDIAVQVSEALSFAHGRGIVHKDVKPENILVEKKRIDVSNKGKALLHYVKITDLGLGMFPGRSQSEIVISEDARTSGVRILSGTLFYMAPEQMVPGRQVDARADVYSLGVVLYEMLTGELPLGMDLPSELNPVVTPELDAICKRALSIDRDVRYQNTREMAADLQKAKEALLLKLVASGTAALEMAPNGKVRRLTPRQLPLEPPARVSYHGPGIRRGWKRAIEWGILGMVVAMLAGSGLAFSRLHRAAREAHRGAEERAQARPRVWGPLTVDSKPHEADVWLDGRRAGTAPAQMDEVSFEPHVIRLTKEFYAPRELVLEPRGEEGRLRYAVIDQATKKDLGVRDCDRGLFLEGIELVRQKGHVTITTPRIDKAEVRIDGDYYDTTPMIDRELDAGAHHFTISKKGCKEFSFYEKIEGGTRITKEIPPLIELGASDPPTAQGSLVRVHLTSSPSGASVYINEEEKGQTPCDLELPPGDVQLRLQKKYYETHTVLLGVTSSVSRDYELVRVKSRVAFDSEPQGATVLVDGVRIESVTPALAESIEGGPHKATFMLEGYFEQTAVFEIVGKEPMDRPVKATLQRIPPGRLSIESELRGVEIHLDGKSIGRAPLAGRPVEGGKHRVRVQGVERAITLEPGLEKKVTFTLKDLEMVAIPDGEFRYGSAEANPGEIYVKTERTGSYYMDRFEVTNEQYGLFYTWISETKDHSRCHPSEGPRDHKPAFWGDEKNKHFNGPSLPVVGVTWYDAYAYAAWCGKRLPAEREWEKAARGTDGRVYPWGNVWDAKKCNSSGKEDGFEFTAPVGSFPGGISPFGCHDMVGNAREWCQDDYVVKNSGKPAVLGKVVRGGSYLGKEWNTTTMREYEGPLHTSSTLGFRCAADERKAPPPADR